MFNACMAFTLSLLVIIVITCAWVTSSPQGPIILLSSLSAILVLILGWFFNND